LSATAQTTAPPGAPDSRQIISAVVASTLGWSLDLYDLFLLLFVAPVMGKLFFPATSPTLSLAAIYASFAVTLLMRPIGSALFGSIADRHGRKRAMTIAVIGVGVVTAAFGVLPTLAQIGVLAPILFIVLRFVQGVFVGGVVASTHTIGTETVPERWRGALSGFVGGGGAGIGALLASVALAIISSAFPGPQFEIWGWRCMFLTGIISAGVGLFAFRALEESPLWRGDAAAQMPHAPVAALTRPPYRNVLLVNLLLTTGGGAGYYLTSGFMPSFLNLVSKLPKPEVAHILILGSVVAIISATSIGALSQIIGRKPTFLLIGVVNIIALPLLYLHLAHLTAYGDVIGPALLIAFLGNAGYAPITIFLNERFPTALRATGTGVSWNLGFAIGGTMPFLVSLFSGSIGGLAPTLASFCAALYLVLVLGALVVPETRGRLQ